MFRSSLLSCSVPYHCLLLAVCRSSGESRDLIYKFTPRSIPSIKPSQHRTPTSRCIHCFSLPPPSWSPHITSIAKNTRRADRESLSPKGERWKARSAKASSIPERVNAPAALPLTARLTDDPSPGALLTSVPFLVYRFTSSHRAFCHAHRRCPKPMFWDTSSSGSP